MSEVPTVLPTRQAVAIEGRSQRGKVTGKLKHALDLMVWRGDKRDDAASAAGLSVDALRAALKKPHVLAHFHAELAALRNSLKARNIHRLDGLADQTENKNAAVAAIKAMEQLDMVESERAPHPGAQQRPGLVIVITGGRDRPSTRIEPPIAPLTIEHEPQVQR